MIGKFYGIGVGPGDPELITIKAVKILEKIDIVICPKSKKESKSVALSIAEGYLNKKAEILKLEFPMTYDEEKLNITWERNSKIILDLLGKGKNIAFLTIGDPMVYSTYMYLLPFLKKKDINIETIPGITSFCASANKVNIPLASQEETLSIIPLRKNISEFEKVVDDYDNLIVMKPSTEHKRLAEILEDRNLEDKFVLVSKCGTNEENISYDIDDLKNKKVPYLSTLIIKKGGI